MHRRVFLAGAAASVATPAFAQSLDFRAAADYSAARRGVSVLVMHEGRITFEDYPSGGSVSAGHELASGTKSFTGIIAAAAVQDRLLRWDEACADTLSEWRNDERRTITIRDLLSLTSGIPGDPIARPPNYADAVATPLSAPRGTRFAYGPTPFQIFGEIIKRKTNADPLAYLTRRVFEPLSITPTHWRRGRDGNPHMPSGAGLTARDWARFGWFVMQEGEGRLDADALAQCFHGSRANPGYGLSWWLWREGLVPPGRTQEVDVDPALVRQVGPISMAAGAGDQRLYLLPQQRLVIARQASGILQALTRRRRRDDGSAWSDAVFLRTLLNA